MSTPVSIVMYHYVRDVQSTPYPELKVLSVKDFTEQVAYIQKHYVVITMEALIAAAQGRGEIPGNALLLTFDDGYRDHYETVFPMLRDLGLQGSFFPPAKAIRTNEVLGVNKIHFILASGTDPQRLVAEINSELDAHRDQNKLESNEAYFDRLAHPNRFDTGEVIFIKRMLQRDIPDPLRTEILGRLFRKYVGEDEEGFSKQLYMSIEELQELRAGGMHVGSHGYDHYFLNSVSGKVQEGEVARSLDFLYDVGCDLSSWTMCYPFGAYDQSLLRLLRRNGCAVGLTTRPEIADLETDDALELPRLDTNDLPKDRGAEPNKWTLRVTAPV